MKCIKRGIIIGILFVLAAGSLSHFMYDWSSRQSVIGLFTPVNESVWEHMKLLFFPMLLYALFLCLRYRENPCLFSAFCAGILAGTFLIPVLFYAYNALLGRDVFLLDIGTFLISVLAAFWLTYKLSVSCKSAPYSFLLYSVIVILLLCFLRFTYQPPSHKIFEDPAKAGPKTEQPLHSCPAIWKYCRSSCSLVSYFTHR